MYSPGGLGRLQGNLFIGYRRVRHAKKRENWPRSPQTHFAQAEGPCRRYNSHEEQHKQHLGPSNTKNYFIRTQYHWITVQIQLSRTNSEWTFFCRDLLQVSTCFLRTELTNLSALQSKTQKLLENMHRLFGKSSSGVGGSGDKNNKKGPSKDGEGEEEETQPTLGDAASKMDSRIGALDTKIKSIDQELLRYKDQMKKAAPGPKAAIQKRALAALKRKKMYESQRDNMANQAFNIEQTAFAIETVQDTQTTIAAMKVATTTLQVEQKKISMDEIEDMQDDLADLLEDQEEVQEILSRSYTVPDGALDEDDLEAELAGLEEEFEGIVIEEETAAPVSLPSNPTQPTTVFSGGITVPDEGSAPIPAGPSNRQAVDEFGLPV